MRISEDDAVLATIIGVIGIVIIGSLIRYVQGEKEYQRYRKGK